VALVMLLASCYLYSTQDYGSQGLKYSKVAVGSSVRELVEGLGAPDVLYEHPKYDTLVYKKRTGSTILGIVTRAEREDYVFVADKAGQIVARGTVDRGEGLTVFGFNTVPISVDGGGFFGGGAGEGSLLAGPDNYGYKD
jgi:hypothetical protein